MKANELIQQFSLYLTDNYSDLLVSENIEELIKKLILEWEKELVNIYGKLDIWLIYYFQQVADIDLTENEKMLVILWNARYSDISCKINYDTLTVSTLYDLMFYKVNCKNVILKTGVTKITNCCFLKSKIESISIPNSVTSIRDYAFSQCIKLKSIIIPDSVTSIEDSAFVLCRSLKSITIPKSVIRIGKGAFYDCDSLTSITISEGVKSIGNCAFDGCISLTNITIPDSVESIGDYAFDLCNNLTSITIGNGVTHLGFYVFNDNYDYREKLTIYTDNLYVRDYAEEEGIKWQSLNKTSEVVKWN